MNKEIFKKFKKEIFSLQDAFGGKVNFLFPEIMKSQIQSAKKVFKSSGVDAKIFYAHKTNSSNAFVTTALENEIGIDVASTKELQNALSRGFVGEKIIATGPKDEDFLFLNILQETTINLDNISELKKVLQISKKLNKKTKILIRISHEALKNYKTESRFGFDDKSILESLKILSENRDNFQFLGFSFHINISSVYDKILMFNLLLNYFELSYSFGFSPNIIDIGGSFRQAFEENDLNFSDQIQEFLDFKIETHGNISVKNLLNEMMITLYIEPGKALVDFAGSTIAKIIYKKSSNEKIFIGTNLKRNEIVPFDIDPKILPFVLKREDNDSIDKNEVFLLGNLCLERDYIFKNKIFLDSDAEENDSIVFLNTGAYSMDFSASSAIMQPLSEKIAIFFQDEKFFWYLDKFYPLKIKI